mmetsp:Transcript_12461/g.35671  ORF Transcript_12461/g.35671 Transcript_12461/m.35671 type:complete len:106 (+) Transcript_12461:1200-1517(+)
MVVMQVANMYENDHPDGDRDDKRAPSKERSESAKAVTRSTCHLKDSNCHHCKTVRNGDLQNSTIGDSSYTNRLKTMKSCCEVTPVTKPGKIASFFAAAKPKTESK